MQTFHETPGYTMALMFAWETVKVVGICTDYSSLMRIFRTKSNDVVDECMMFFGLTDMECNIEQRDTFYAKIL